MKIAIITSGFLPVLDGVTLSGFEQLEKLSSWGQQVLLFIVLIFWNIWMTIF